MPRIDGRFLSPSARIRLAGGVAAVSGLIGSWIWLNDLADRADGDSLRFGVFHNPLMQIPKFHVAFQELQMEVLFCCAVASLIGGVLLQFQIAAARHLVTLQARVSIITNVTVCFFIVGLMFIWWWHPTRLNDTPRCLTLRLTSAAVNLALWAYLSGDVVREHFRWRSHGPGRSFPVIAKEPHAVAE